MWLGQCTDTDIASTSKASDTNFKLADGNGDPNSYTLTINFTVPELPHNAANYMLCYYNARLSSEGQAFTFWLKIVPDIQINPSSASPGDTVAINGTGFSANDDLSLTFDGQPTRVAAKTNNLGSFTANYTLPVTIAGQHILEAAVPDMNGVDSAANLSLVPKISVEPNLPQVGSTATISGSGFAANSEVSIDYDGTKITSSPTTDEVGSFSYAFKVPPGTTTEHSVIATDKAGNKAVLGAMHLNTTAPSSPTPMAPLGQRFGWLGPQLVTFNWSDVSDPNGISYTIEIGDNLNFFPLEPGMRKTGLTSTSCILKLKPGTYYWRVKAVNGAGSESQWTLSPYPFSVGFFSITYLILGGLILVLVIVLVIRAAFRRVSEYY